MTESMYQAFEKTVDFRRMHDYRVARAQAAMEKAQVDGLILFGDDNSTYVSSALRNYPAVCSGLDISALVTVVKAGDTAPLIFTPDLDCVPEWHPLDRAKGLVYVEMPSAIAAFAQRAADFLGRPAPRRIGIDVISPMVLEAVRKALPGTEIVDANPILWQARLVKNQDELTCLRSALKIAEGGMADVVAAIRPGVTENQLHGVYLKGICDRGADWSVFADVITKYPLSHAEIPHLPKDSLPWRRVKQNRVLNAGDPLSLDAGALFHGYFSDFGRSWIVPPFERGATFEKQRDLCKQWHDITNAMLAQCKAGNTIADIHRAAGSGTVPAPFSVHGMGLYLEPPTGGGRMTPERLAEEEQWVLAENWVLNIEPYTWAEGAGGYRADETIIITRTGYEKISAFPHGPLFEA